MKSLHEPTELITSPLRAIRANCIDCMGGQRSLVRDCGLRGCPLWPYRMGKNPFRMIRNLTLEQRSEIGERLRRGREQA
jgi:hypothetical protein